MASRLKCLCEAGIACGRLEPLYYVLQVAASLVKRHAPGSVEHRIAERMVRLVQGEIHRHRRRHPRRYKFIAEG